jgi:hypothetical protein
MKIATLVCITEGEVNGDVTTFDISRNEGREKAIAEWKDRIRQVYDTDSEHEVLARIEDGIINEYDYHSGVDSFTLFFSELE